MSSASPPKEPDVEPETQSGDDPEQMDRDNQDPSGQGQDFEVKEQDRWLPIANGVFFCSFHVPASDSMQSPLFPFLLRAAGCFPFQSRCP
jgi:hypothetical protein